MCYRYCLRRACPDFMSKVINRANRTLLTSNAGLENAKALITKYKQGEIPSMTPELWQAKKVVDSTLHPGTPEAQYRHHGT